MTIRKAFGFTAIAVSAAAAPVTFGASEGVFRRGMRPGNRVRGLLELHSSIRFGFFRRVR